MLRSFIRSISTLILCSCAAALLLIAALVAAGAILLAGTYVALWSPSQRVGPLTAIIRLIGRTR